MRTLRLSLAGTVTLVLLGALGGAVVAQESNAHVTGTMACGPAGASTVLEGGSISLELWSGRCDVSMSDPRVSGVMDSDLQTACFGETGGCLFHITSVLTGPDGTWEGTAGSMDDASGTALPAWGTLEGTGAYEGWTFILHNPNRKDRSAEVSGVVYEGPPPPWNEALPLAATE
jgi:hypothetical protein